MNKLSEFGVPMTFHVFEAIERYIPKSERDAVFALILVRIQAGLEVFQEDSEQLQQQRLTLSKGAQTDPK